jgi:hypothetical protein
MNATTKTFNVELRCDKSTRWLANDEQIAGVLRSLAASVAIAHSTGMQPDVRVVHVATIETPAKPV